MKIQEPENALNVIITRFYICVKAFLEA